MDTDRFDGITRAFAEARSRRAAIGALLSALRPDCSVRSTRWVPRSRPRSKRPERQKAKQNENGNGGGGNDDGNGNGNGNGNEDKVTICHRTGSESNRFVEISVPRHAAEKHVERKHGDTYGPCACTSSEDCPNNRPICLGDECVPCTEVCDSGEECEECIEREPDKPVVTDMEAT